MQYRVKWNYKSSYGGPWEAGQVVELDAKVAEKVNDDSPGVLEAAGEPKAERTRAMDAPTNDRMIKGGRKRGQQEFVMGRDQPGYGKELKRGE